MNPMLRLWTAFVTVPLLLTLSAFGQSSGKPKLGIGDIQATDAVMQQAQSSNQADALRQILQGANGLLESSLAKTGRFDLISRSEVAKIIREQDFTQSGNVDPNDPQAARTGRIAGTSRIALVTVDNYQDVTTRADLEGQFGKTPSERREIQLQATLRIYDTTTARLTDVQTITLEKAALNEVLPGATQTGRATNQLIGQVTATFAQDASNAIMNAMSPAKVMAYTMGVVTFNRGDGTGVQKGQVWEILQPGQALIDPDTGENLGSEEIHIGWSIVDSVSPKFSKAKVVEDNGITKGAIMRPAASLPPGIDPNATVTRGFSSTASPGSVGGGVIPVSNPTTNNTNNTDSNPTSGTAVNSSATASSTNGTVALFIGDVATDVPDNKIDVLEQYLASSLTKAGYAIISRRDVLNAVAGFGEAGSNRGGGTKGADDAERLLSDQASAKALAGMLGASEFVVATIASLDVDRRTLTDPKIDVATEVVITTLDVPWRLIDGASGAAIGADTASATDTIRQSGTLQRSPTDVDVLLREAGRTIANQAMAARSQAEARRPAATTTAQVAVEISIDLREMTVPGIVKKDGTWTVTTDRYNVIPQSAEILVDGLLVGTAPGTVQMNRGPQRLRLAAPDLEPVDRFVNAQPGLKLRIPMQLTPAGRQRWLQSAAFFEALKDGAALREDQQKIADGIKAFLEQSHLRIDTSNVTTIGGYPLFWANP